MTRDQKWARWAKLNARANALYAEWNVVCKEINKLLMTRTTDDIKRRRRP